MRRSQIGWALLTILALMLIGQTGGANEKLDRRANTVLYQLKEGASSSVVSALNRVLVRHGMSTKRELLNGKIKQALAHNPKISEEQLAKEILATGAVDFAEPDYRVAPSALSFNGPYVPNDPIIGWHHSAIGSAYAWGYTMGSPTIKVAVCDTGIASSHPDLSANMALPGFNSVDNSTNTEPGYPHGTAVASALAATSNNGIGIAGAAGAVRILPGKISNDDANGFATLSDATECIRWAADQGAKVVNLSHSFGNTSSLDSAAQYLRGKGGLLIACAGNQGSDLSGQSDVASYIIVGATDESGYHVSWSNYGTPIDIVAPGNNVYAIWLPYNDYLPCWGTSLATPLVAGAAALIYSINPNFTPSQVENFLFSTANNLGDGKIYGNGGLNAAAAVEAAALYGGSPINQAPVAVASADITSGSAPLIVNFSSNGSYDPDGSIVSMSWNLGDGGTAGGTAGGTSVQFATPGSYVVTLTVVDNSGASAVSSVTIQVSAPPPNPAPALITITGVTPNSVKNGETVTAVISGFGFLSGASVRLENGGGSAPQISAIVVAGNGTSISAKIRFKSGGPSRTRYWDLVVTNPNGSSARLNRAILVQP
jgi:thermitase